MARQILTIEAKIEVLQKDLDRLQEEFYGLVSDKETAKPPSPIQGQDPRASNEEPGEDESDGVDSSERVKIAHYIAARPNVQHDALTLTRVLGMHPDSVRSNLSALFRDGKIERPTRGFYVAIPGVTGKQ
ncbi:MAG: hypothetical protein WDO69_09810 [Pseudomonadota bacterium]